MLNIVLMTLMGKIGSRPFLAIKVTVSIDK